MTPREAFKVAFLSRCVENGLDWPEIHTQVKLAMDKVAGIGDLPGKAWELAAGVLKPVAGYGAAAALIAPPAAGALAGYGAAKMTDMDDTDVAEVKQREIMNELARQTDKLRRDKAIRDYAKMRKQTGRVFL